MDFDKEPDENEALEAKCDLLSASLKKHDAESEALRGQLQNAEQNIACQALVASELEKQLEALRAENAQLAARLDHDANQRALRAFAAENEALRGQVAHLSERLDYTGAAFGARVDALLEECKSLRADNEALRKQLPTEAERAVLVATEEWVTEDDFGPMRKVRLAALRAYGKKEGE